MGLSQRISIALMFCLSARAQDPAGINGWVVDSVTGQPMSRVHVRLLVTSRGEGFSAAYGAQSDEHGRFSISRLPPGTYLLEPERSGYYFVPSANNGPPQHVLTLKAGQRLDDFRIEMAPHAILSGHVIGANGPVESAFLHLEPASESDIGLQLALEIRGIRGANVHNERGEFRISVPPGKYYLRVQGGSAGDDIQPDGTMVSRFFSDTYYPDVANKKSATVVEARAGKETAGLDISVRNQTPLSITGTISGVPAGVTALVKVRWERTSQSRDLEVGGNGSFSAENLQPGTYYIYAESGSGPNRLRSSTVEVELQGVPITGLALTLRPLARITGTLQLALANGVFPRTVRLEPLGDFMMARNNARVATLARGSAFEIGGVEPELYRLTVFPLPENGYIKAVLLDGAAVQARVVDNRFASDGESSAIVPVLDLRNGANGSKLTIVIGVGASLSGKLTGVKGSVTHGFAAVILVPEGKSSEADTLVAPIGSDGTYAFHGLPPGKYRLVGADALQGAGEEPTLEKMLARAKSIELKEGDRITNDVDVSTKEGGVGKK